ncbi:MAG: hypothetical protein NXI31_02365 [bacterium]|nr:hypothetical protein [bacterium]
MTKKPNPAGSSGPGDPTSATARLRGLALDKSDPRYAEASDACRNYSDLTLKSRTLGQQIMLGYSVAIGITLSRSAIKDPQLGTILVIGGCVLLALSIPLHAVTRHYANAFWAMRNWLAAYERLRYEPTGGEANFGPWHAHKTSREKRMFSDGWSTNLPFGALVALAIASIVAGASLTQGHWQLFGK